MNDGNLIKSAEISPNSLSGLLEQLNDSNDSSSLIFEDFSPDKKEFVSYSELKKTIKNVCIN